MISLVLKLNRSPTLIIPLLIIKLCLHLPPTMSTSGFPKSVAGFGYGFNYAGKLRKIDPETGVITDTPFEFNISDNAEKNQRHYEALGELLNEHVYQLLLDEGLQKIHIPSHLPDDQATFVFSNRPDFKNSTKLLVLINGSGVVRAGQWSRSLIINQSLNHGTQLPYIKKAMSLGYDILVMNTNENQRNGRPLEGSERAVSHGRLVWNEFIRGKDIANGIAIVAHSYGGVVTLDLANEFSKEFKEKVFAVGFTDSVHGRCGSEVGKLFHDIGRNWVTSTKPLNTLLGDGSSSDTPRYSAGHTKHEWTSWAAIDAVFEFFEDKHKHLGLKEKLEL